MNKYEKYGTRASQLRQDWTQDKWEQFLRFMRGQTYMRDENGRDYYFKHDIQRFENQYNPDFKLGTGEEE